MQGCMICPTPTNHVRNLDKELNIDETNSTPSTLADLPQPPPDHLILMSTRRLHTIIQQNNVELLKSTIKLLQISIESNLDFLMYDCSAFDAAWKTASDILATHASMSSIIPAPPPLLLSTINNLTPVSNLLSLIPLPGAANLQTSTPGCRPSWTGSTWPEPKKMLKWLSLKMPFLLQTRTVQQRHWLAQLQDSTIIF